MAKSLNTYSLLTTSFVLVAAVVSPPAFAEQTAYIDDAAISGWAKDAVTYLTEEGLLKGNGHGFFNPKQALTRAEAAVIFTRALNIEVDQMVAPTFEDTKSHWAAKEIAAIQRAFPEVLKGYEDGTFQPDKTITRAEFAKLFVSFFELDSENFYHIEFDGSPFVKASDVLIPFSDHETWAKTYIETFYKNGYVTGVDAAGQEFAPEQSVTREMVATFFYRHYYELARNSVNFKDILIPEPGQYTSVTTEPTPKHFGTNLISDAEIRVGATGMFIFSESIQNDITYILKDGEGNELLRRTGGIGTFRHENNEAFEPGNYAVDIYYKQKFISSHQITINPTYVDRIRMNVNEYFVGEPANISLELYNHYGRKLSIDPADFKWKVINKTTGQVIDTVVYDESLQNFVLTSDEANSEDTLIVQAIHKPTLITTKKEIKLNAKREYDYLMITTIQEDGYFYAYSHDQYNKEINLPSFERFTISSSNEDVVESAMISMHKTDRVGLIRFEIAEIKSAGSTRIRVHDTISGKSYSNIIEVK